MVKDEVKFPNVTVKLTGENGNAFMVMGLTMKAMRKAGCIKEETDAYQAECMSGDYDHLLRVTMQTVNVE